MLTVRQARDHILGGLSPLPSEAVSIGDALGCVASVAVIAEVPVPSFANSAMDGFAVYAADTARVPVRLTVVGVARAGRGAGSAVARGEAVRIMTGAPIPVSADAVCVVEHTHVENDGGVVVIESQVATGANVRFAGEDIRVGQEVISPGTVLSPAHLGVLASLGTVAVEVHRRPRVGVLSTGDELAEGAGPLVADKIRDANRPILLALCRQAGFDAFDLGIAGDDEAVITATLRQGASSCDAIVTTGGVSVGETDLVKVVLDKLSGGTMRSMSIAVKPTKHVA